jgi:purine-binding chemotaxis protein CheW
MSASKRVCWFEVDQVAFGIEVLHIQELIKNQPISRVPLADPVVAGLINLRGQIVVAIELRERLRLSARPGDTPPMHLVVQTKAGTYSLLVDRIGDVIELDATQLERPPETMPREVRELVTATCKLPDRLLLIIDAECAVALASQGDTSS